MSLGGHKQIIINLYIIVRLVLFINQINKQVAMNYG